MDERSKTPKRLGNLSKVTLIMGFPGGSDSKESGCNAGDSGSIPASGRSPGEGNGYPLQYSCLENSTNRGAWQAIVHGVAKRVGHNRATDTFTQIICMVEPGF